MTELDDVTYAQITELSEKINELIEQENYKKALELSWEGYDLLPDPKTNWEACLWFLVTIGDINFLTQDYQAAFDNFSNSMHCDGAIGQPFIHLRLGQSAFELGKLDKAADELTRAMMGAGEDILLQEDPKYFTFLKTKLSPPPGGWSSDKKKPFWKLW